MTFDREAWERTNREMEALHQSHCDAMPACSPGFSNHCACSCCTPLPGCGIDNQFARANSCCCYCGELWPGYSSTIRDKAMGL